MSFTILNPIRRLLAASRRSGIGIDGIGTKMISSAVESQRGTKLPHSKFWRNTRTEKHYPDDPLNTDPPITGAPPAPRAHRFKCVFCDCVMTGDGESIWSMGTRAKEYDEAKIKHAKAIEKKDEEITALQRELTAVKAERDALKPASGGASPRRIGSRIQ